MNGTATRFAKFGVGLLGLVTLGWILTGNAKPGEQKLPFHEGVPTDWSNSHLIFSKPASDDEARKLGEDPRYWHQLYRRELARTLADPAREVSPQVAAAVHPTASGGLWSEDLGNNAAPGAANFPAKYGFGITTANCASATNPDYVVYSTGLLGSGTQASVVAYDNIYSGCTGTVPTVYWAYNTGGLILTSPVLSLDGSQVAFVQTSGSPTGQSSLVVLKWKSSATETVGSPGVPTLVPAASYPVCVAPCMTQILLVDGSNVPFDDRTSSIFYDYTNDVGWVGGQTGWLVKLTGLFKGTALSPPTEVKTGGFPKHVNPSNPNALSSPVYDRNSKNVFVGDAGGLFYRVASATGTVTTSAQLDFGAGLSSPLLDQTNGFIYVFASSDGTNLCTGGTACAAVYVLGTSFAGGSAGSKVTAGQSVVLGTLPNPNPLYRGGLDSAYYNSVGGTGSMYVCGNTGAAPSLYRIPVASGALGTAVRMSGLTAAAHTPACSPVTDFPNPNSGNVSKQELIFFSTQNFGLPCANKGCLMNFVSQPWQPQTTYKQGQEILVLRTANNTLYINSAATLTGKSGTSAPTWPAVVGQKTTDGTVSWVNQGTTTIVALGTWVANRAYGLQARITDGTNIEVVVGRTGPSGATTPSWSPAVGGTTPDGGLTWINAGPWPSVQRTITGGTGGVIIDNAAGSTGASQVYFFTLGNQLCTTSGGTGGCAMQASQSSLN